MKTIFYFSMACLTCAKAASPGQKNLKTLFTTEGHGEPRKKEQTKLLLEGELTKQDGLLIQSVAIRVHPWLNRISFGSGFSGLGFTGGYYY